MKIKSTTQIVSIKKMGEAEINKHDITSLTESLVKVSKYFFSVPSLKSLKKILQCRAISLRKFFEIVNKIR